MELSVLLWVLIELAIILILLFIIFLIEEKHSKVLVKILDGYSKLLIQNEELRDKLNGGNKNERVKKEDFRDFE